MQCDVPLTRCVLADDPPYAGNEQSYGKGMFSFEDFQEMAAVLGDLQGHAILSINDTPEIRETFAGLHMEEVRLTYSAGLGDDKAARELLISNTPDGSRLL